MKKNIEICFLLFILGFLLSSCTEEKRPNSQPIQNSSLLKHIVMESLADKKFFENNIDSAVKIYQQIITQSDLQNKCTARADIKIGSWHFSRQCYETAIESLQNGLDVYNCQKIPLSKSDYNYMFGGGLLIANCYRLLGQFNLAFNYLDELEISVKQNCLLENSKYLTEILSDIYSWKALAYFDNGSIENSVYYNIKAINIILNSDCSECIVSDNYAELGRIFMNEGEFLKSELYYKKAANIISECYGDTCSLFAEKLLEIGLLYLESSRFSDAIDYFNLSQEISENNLYYDDIDLAFNYNNLADAYCGLNQYYNAIKYYKLALNIFMQNNYIEEASVMNHNLGIAYYSMGDFPISENYYQISLEMSRSISAFGNIYTSYTHQRLGQLFQSQNKYLGAIDQYSKAISIIQDHDLSTFSNEGAFLQSNILSKTELFKSLYQQGICQFQLYKESNNKLPLLESIKTFRKALLTSDYIRLNYNYFEAKLSLNEISIPLIYHYLNSLLQLSNIHLSPDTDNEILEAVDRTKYTALRSLIHSTSAIQDIPALNYYQSCIDSLLNTVIWREDYNMRVLGQKTNISKTISFDEQLFKATFSLDTIISSLKSNVPEFRNNFYDLSFYKIAEIQNLLPDSTCIIEYALFENILVSIAITNSCYDIQYVGCDSSIYQLKNEFRKSIVFSNRQNIAAIGDFFYRLLIEPISHVINDCDKLIIIPDLIFSNFPFEALSRQENLSHCSKNPNPYYLICQYEISYYLSMSLWGDHYKSTNISNSLWKYDFMGLVPKLDHNNHKHNYLPYSNEEIHSISKVLTNSNKKININDTNVTEKEILQGLKESKIVHIVSHSGIIKEEKEYYIQVDKADVKSSASKFLMYDEKLQLAEIYSTHITSDLVTLSACSSGLGKNYSGEGILSLTYGLYYAGARNILYSLWDVSDFHTTVFMKNFYHYINSGFSYSKALQKTKIDFINSEFNLPVFWSGFILNG